MLSDASKAWMGRGFQPSTMRVRNGRLNSLTRSTKPPCHSNASLKAIHGIAVPRNPGSVQSIAWRVHQEAFWLARDGSPNHCLPIGPGSYCGGVICRLVLLLSAASMTDRTRTRITSARIQATSALCPFSHQRTIVPQEKAQSARPDCYPCSSGQ